MEAIGDVMEWSCVSKSLSCNTASHRKRRSNSGLKCIGQREEPFAPFVPVDSEDPPSKKKGKPPVGEQQTKNVSGTMKVEDTHHSLCDNLVNKLSSPVRFIPSPGSDSNSTIPLEIEQTDDVSEVIVLAVLSNEDTCTISNNPCATESSEKNKLSTSKETLNLPRKVADMAKRPAVTTEPPGNFAFIDFGVAPSSLCSGLDKSNDASVTFSAHGEATELTSLPDLRNSELSYAVMEKKDLTNYSPSPPTLSPSVNQCSILPSPSEPDANDLSAVSGISPLDVSSDQDYAVLPEDASMPLLSQSPLHIFDHDHFSHFSAALREREEYIPLNVGTDELEMKELELRKAACKTKELLAPIIAASKRLENERELLKSKLTELHADMTVRAEVINSLSDTSTFNKEQIEQNLNERNRQQALMVEVKIRLVKKELAMRELQVAICQEKLLAVSSDTPVDSHNLEIAANQEKVITFNVDIHQCYEEQKMAKEKLLLLDEQLKKDMEEEKLLRRRINELDLQQTKAKSLLLKNEESLRGATLELKELIKQRKTHSAYFVNLERMMVKIKMCRKLKELDRKEERIIGCKEIQPNNYHDKAKSTSNVQYASQLTVFGTSYQPTISEQTTISRGSSSVQHYRSLQSIAIQNQVPWIPRSFLPLPRFSPGLLQIVPIALPWVGPHEP